MSALLNAMAAAINSGIGRVIRRLPLDCEISSEALRDTLRLEVDREHEYLISFEGRYGTLGDEWSAAFRTHIGPRKFIGVAVYVVDNLPEPGWRLVNPLEFKS